MNILLEINLMYYIVCSKSLKMLQKYHKDCEQLQL